jgi:hypothetical protein
MCGVPIEGCWTVLLNLFASGLSAAMRVAIDFGKCVNCLLFSVKIKVNVDVIDAYAHAIF